MPKKRNSLRSSNAVADDASLSEWDSFVSSANAEDSESYVDEDSVAASSNAYDDGNVSNDASDYGSSSHDGKGPSTKFKTLCYRLVTQTLTELAIDMSAIGNTANEIAELLPSNSSLKKLALIFNRNHLETKELDQCNVLKMLCSGLAKNSYIADVQIRYAHLNRDVAFLLGATFAQNQSLQKICLKNCIFIDSGLAVLFLGMQHNKQIQELAILSCDLSGSNSFVVAASLPLMKLKSLTLDSTKLTLEGIRFLCDRIENSPNLNQLNLSRNALDRDMLKVLISCLRCRHQKVEKIDLSCCGLDDASVKQLAKGLSQNPTLASINLSENDFGDDGAKCLKVLLNTNNAIKELCVDGCRISKKRLKSIADGVRYNNFFLKSLFSEDISLAILESVDLIENLGSSASEGAARIVSPY